MTTKNELIQIIKLYVSYGIDTIIENDSINFIKESEKLLRAKENTTPEIKEININKTDKQNFNFTNFNFNKETTNENKTKEQPTDLFIKINNEENQEFIQATIEAEKQAQQIADESKTLEELKEKTKASTFCTLKKYAKNFVFGEGIENSPLAMIIGEAPGADEDIQGKPFVGVSGQLLTKALETIGLSRETNFYITNIIKWRPPGNRTPTREEIKICIPIIRKQIELIKPKMIILIGAVAATGLLNTTEGITKIRGQIFEYNGLKVISTFHPSYLLRNPIAKKQTYIDMLKIKKIINEIQE